MFLVHLVQFVLESVLPSSHYIKVNTDFEIIITIHILIHSSLLLSSHCLVSMARRLWAWLPVCLFTEAIL